MRILSRTAPLAVETKRPAFQTDFPANAILVFSRLKKAAARLVINEVTRAYELALRRLRPAVSLRRSSYLPRFQSQLSSLLAAHGVRGQEKQNSSTDAYTHTLKVVNSTIAPNEFVRIAKESGPAVVNINTQTLPKQSANRRVRAATAIPNPHAQPPSGGNGDDGGERRPGQKGRVRETSRTSSTSSSAARFLIRRAAMTTRCASLWIELYRRFKGLHHHQ